MTKTKIVAIGSNGLRHVVWGYGSTEDYAIEDAQSNSETLDSNGSALVEVDADVIARIECVVVDCTMLGIEVSTDSNGDITVARIKP